MIFSGHSIIGEMLPLDAQLIALVPHENLPYRIMPKSCLILQRVFTALSTHWNLLAIWNQYGSVSADAALSTHLNLLANVVFDTLSTHWNIMVIWNQYGLLSADVALSIHLNLPANVTLVALSAHWNLLSIWNQYGLLQGNVQDLE